jgi:hypothetical protein
MKESTHTGESLECPSLAEAVEELSAESEARNNGIGMGDRLIHCCA